MNDLPTPRLFLTIFLSLMAIALVVRAAGRSFWFDEMATWEMVQLDGWSARVEALGKGADSQPPLFYTIEATALALPLPENIALRIPSILAFLAGTAGVYLAATLLATEWAGLAAAGVWALTSAMPYGLEARPYGLWMAAAAWAIACFIGATLYPADRRWTLGLAAALSLAVCVHYFAVTLLPPLAIAGLIHDVRRRKIFWRLWLALVPAAALFILEFPLLQTFRALYAPHFWTKTAGRELLSWYHDVLLHPAEIAALIGAGAAIFAFQCWRERAWPRWALAPVTLLLMLALLPLPARLLVERFQFNLAFRYLVSLVPAVAIIGGMVAAGLVRVGRFRVAPLAILMPTVAFALITIQQPFRWAAHQDSQGTVPFRQRLLADPRLPIVIGTSFDYLTWNHYEQDTALRARLFALSDSNLAIRYTHTDSIDLAVALLPGAQTRQVANPTLFVSVYPQFYLITGDKSRWVADFLGEQKADMQFVDRQGPWQLLRVTYHFH